MENVSEKRVVKTEETTGLGLKEIILVAILLAAGAVLKAFAGSIINFGGMKPNFIIAMYCLAIIVIKPRFRDAAIIGILAGVTCQFLPGTPGINIISELVGAIVMYLMIKLPAKFDKVDLRPTISTAVATFISGMTYLGLLYLLYFAGLNKEQPVALAVFLGIIAGTTLINTIIVTLLYVPVKLAFKK